MIGGLIAEQDRHPELINAFRERILLPRRAIVRSCDRTRTGARRPSP
jgi:hypothetical protein